MEGYNSAVQRLMLLLEVCVGSEVEVWELECLICERMGGRALRNSSESMHRRAQRQDQSA